MLLVFGHDFGHAAQSGSPTFDHFIEKLRQYVNFQVVPNKVTKLEINLHNLQQLFRF